MRGVKLLTSPIGLDSQSLGSVIICKRALIRPQGRGILSVLSHHAFIPPFLAGNGRALVDGDGVLEAARVSL